VRTADFDVALSFAVMVAGVLALTAVVFTVKVIEVMPPGIVTVAGTIAEDRLLESVITAPPAGAGPVRVTVPVEDAPPATVVGLRLNADRTAGVIVRVAVLEVGPRSAVMLTAVCEATPVVVIVNVTDVFPAGTVTNAGTDAAPLLLVRFSETPPVGAAVPRVIVPVEVLPPNTEVGLRLSPVTAGGLMVKLADSDTPLRLPEIVATV
jgi:hypothetical protein